MTPVEEANTSTQPMSQSKSWVFAPQIVTGPGMFIQPGMDPLCKLKSDHKPKRTQVTINTAYITMPETQQETPYEFSPLNSPSETGTARKDDPYEYQYGFGNYHTSEAVPNVIVQGQNTPQRVKYGLYSEQLNGTSFVSSRDTLQHVWFYRIMPSAARGEMRLITGESNNTDVEAVFSPTNDKVQFDPRPRSWPRLRLPGEPEQKTHVDHDKKPGIDFVRGMKTICGHGDATAKEGMAVHMYAADKSMEKVAFCNNDGDMLIIPQQGELDIQLEMGKMRVKPKEIAVIQAGIRFKVDLVDNKPIYGYIQELFGSHYQLPELGPVGSNGLAMPRDFQFPVAHFDKTAGKNEWEIMYKVAGKFWSYRQDHTPFDVVAWHGNYVPYKYDTRNFVPSAVAARDQSDPSIYTVLTAPSRVTGASIADFMVFVPRWNAAENSLRIPYYHRNMATEIMGLIFDTTKTGHGSSRTLGAGGLSYEASFMPHGESYEACQEAENARLKPEQLGLDHLAFMMQINAHCAVTNHALSSSQNTMGMDVWKSMEPRFWHNIECVNKDIESINRRWRQQELEPIKIGEANLCPS